MNRTNSLEELDTSSISWQDSAALSSYLRLRREGKTNVSVNEYSAATPSEFGATITGTALPFSLDHHHHHHQQQRLINDTNVTPERRQGWDPVLDQPLHRQLSSYRGGSRQLEQQLEQPRHHPPPTPLPFYSPSSSYIQQPVEDIQRDGETIEEMDRHGLKLLLKAALHDKEVHRRELLQLQREHEELQNQHNLLQQDAQRLVVLVHQGWRWRLPCLLQRRDEGRQTRSLGLAWLRWKQHRQTARDHAQRVQQVQRLLRVCLRRMVSRGTADLQTVWVRWRRQNDRAMLLERHHLIHLTAVTRGREMKRLWRRWEGLRRRHRQLSSLLHLYGRHRLRTSLSVWRVFSRAQGLLVWRQQQRAICLRRLVGRRPGRDLAVRWAMATWRDTLQTGRRQTYRVKRLGYVLRSAGRRWLLSAWLRWRGRSVALLRLAYQQRLCLGAVYRHWRRVNHAEGTRAKLLHRLLWTGTRAKTRAAWSRWQTSLLLQKREQIIGHLTISRQQTVRALACLLRVRNLSAALRQWQRQALLTAADRQRQVSLRQTDLQLTVLRSDLVREAASRRQSCGQLQELQQAVTRQQTLRGLQRLTAFVYQRCDRRRLLLALQLWRATTQRLFLSHEMLRRLQTQRQRSLATAALAVCRRQRLLVHLLPAWRRWSGRVKGRGLLRRGVLAVWRRHRLQSACLRWVQTTRRCKEVQFRLSAVLLCYRCKLRQSAWSIWRRVTMRQTAILSLWRQRRFFLLQRAYRRWSALSQELALQTTSYQLASLQLVAEQEVLRGLWLRWRSWQRQQVVRQRLVTSLLQRGRLQKLRYAFARWTQRYSRDYQLLKRALLRWSAAQQGLARQRLHRALHNWHYLVITSHYRLQTKQLSLQRASSLERVQSLDQTQSQLDDLNRELLLLLQQTQASLGRQREQRLLQHGRQRDLRCLGRVYQSWVGLVRMRQRQQLYLQRRGEQKLAVCYRRWTLLWIMHRQLRREAGRARLQEERQRLQKLFWHWRQETGRWKLRCQALKSCCHLLRPDRQPLLAVRRVFGRWQTQTAEQGHLDQDHLAGCWRQWQAWMTRRRQLRGTVGRWLARRKQLLVQLAFARWQRACRLLVDLTALQRTRQQQLAKLLGQRYRAILRQHLRLWRGVVVNLSARRGQALYLLGRERLRLQRSWQAWRSSWQQRCRRRQSLRRCLRGLTVRGRAAVQSLLARWQRKVQQLRLEERSLYHRQLLLMQRQREHRLRRFFRGWYRAAQPRLLDRALLYGLGGGRVEKEEEMKDGHLMLSATFSRALQDLYEAVGNCCCSQEEEKEVEAGQRSRQRQRLVLLSSLQRTAERGLQQLLSCRPGAAAALPASCSMHLHLHLYLLEGQGDEKKKKKEEEEEEEEEEREEMEKRRQLLQQVYLSGRMAMVVQQGQGQGQEGAKRATREEGQQQLMMVYLPLYSKKERGGGGGEGCTMVLQAAIVGDIKLLQQLQQVMAGTSSRSSSNRSFLAAWRPLARLLSLDFLLSTALFFYLQHFQTLCNGDELLSTAGWQIQLRAARETVQQQAGQLAVQRTQLVQLQEVIAKLEQSRKRHKASQEVWRQKWHILSQQTEKQHAEQLMLVDQVQLLRQKLRVQRDYESQILELNHALKTAVEESVL